MGDGRCPAGLDGRRRVQARRARPDLPEVHLRRLRGAPCRGSGRVRGRRRRGPRRVHRREHLLGAAGGPLDAPEGSGEAVDHRPDRRSGDGGARARQPRARGRAAARLRPARAGQAPARAADRPDQQRPGRRRGRPLARRARPRLRVLPLAVRERRGQEGRRVLHAALRRQGAGGDARAVPRPGLRPLLRLVGHVRAVGRVHPRPRQRQRERRQGARRHQHLRPGVELHDLAAGEDEPRHPRHRGADRPRRQLPQRPAPGPEGRLHPRQPAVQRVGLGRRAPGRRQALALRRAAEGQRQLRLGAAHGAPPRTGRHRRVRARQRVDVVEPVGRGRDSEEPDRGRPGGLHGRAARPALLLDPDSRLSLVPGPPPAAPRRGPVHRRPQARTDGRPHPPRADRRRRRPHRRRLPRLARRLGRLRRPRRLLQERPARRGPPARPRVDAGALRRRRAAAGRRRAVRGEDAAAGRGAAARSRPRGRAWMRPSPRT